MLVNKSDVRLNIVGFEVDSARRRDVAELRATFTEKPVVRSFTQKRLLNWPRAVEFDYEHGWTHLS